MVEFIKGDSEAKKLGDESLDWVEMSEFNQVVIGSASNIIEKNDKPEDSKIFRPSVRSLSIVAPRKSSRTMRNFIQLFKNFKNLLGPEDDLQISYNKIMESFRDPGFFSLYTKNMRQKVKLVFKSTIIIHLTAFLLSCALMELRELSFCSMCFLPGVCNCDKRIWLRTMYIYILLVVRLLVPMCTMYYCVFHIKELTKKRIYMISYAACHYSILWLKYLLSDENGFFPVQQILLTGWIIHFALCFIYFLLLNFPFKHYVQKLHIPLMISIFCYMYFLVVTLVMPQFQDFLYSTHKKSIADIIFSTVGSLMANFLLLVYELSMRKYDSFMQRENLNYQPAMFFCKYTLAICMTLRIGSILRVSPWSPSFLISSVSLSAFLIDFHLGYNIITYNIRKLFARLLFKKNMKFEYPSTITFKLISFQHIDFMFIYIPRISWFILRKRWLSPPFYKPTRTMNCKLDLPQAESESISVSAFLIFALMDVAITTGLILFLSFKKIGLNKYFVERENIFFRVFINMSFHFFIESMLGVYDM